MTPAERFQRAGDLFLDALELPFDQRRQFLSETCGADAGLFDEALRLLEAHSKTTRFLDRSVMNVLPFKMQSGPRVLECPECGLCFEVKGTEQPELTACKQDGATLVTAFEGAALIDGKYYVERRLGRGGMGTVYRVRHVGLDRQFALKLIHSDYNHSEGWLELFAGEAKSLGQLKHPNIVDVTDYGIDPRKMPYLVTELLEGQPLDEFCRQCGALDQVPFERALPILEAVANALDFMHSRGISHGDIKPSNVFLAGVPKLMDFGLAAAPKMAGGLHGTPQYLAPELIVGGPASPSSDVYALGALSYKILTGRLPFEGTLGAILDAHRSVSPPPASSLNAAVPFELDAPLAALLAKDPGNRPGSAGEAVKLIRQAWLASRQRLWRTAETPRRLKIAALAAPLLWIVSLALSGLTAVRDFELQTVDARFAARPMHPPRPEIVLVLVDEPSLAADSTPLADRGTEFANTIEKLYDAGAKGVALDLLLPETWSRSPEFSRLVLRNAGRLVLGLYSSLDGKTTGTEGVSGLTGAALGRDRLDSLFAFVNTDEDPDGVVRHGRISYTDRTGRPRLTWPAAAVANLGSLPALPERFWLDQNVDAGRFTRVSWASLSDRLQRDPTAFRNRLILIGGDFLGSGDSDHRTRADGPLISGTLLQAITANSILSGSPIRDVSAWVGGLSTCILVGTVMAACLTLPHRLWTAVAGGAALSILAGTAWVLFCWAGLVLPVVAPALAILIGFLSAIVFWRVLPTFPAG